MPRQRLRRATVAVAAASTARTGPALEGVPQAPAARRFEAGAAAGASSVEQRRRLRPGPAASMRATVRGDTRRGCSDFSLFFCAVPSAALPAQRHAE